MAETTANGLCSAKVHSTAVNGESVGQKKVSVVKQATENKFDLSKCLDSKISQCL